MKILYDLLAAALVTGLLIGGCAVLLCVHAGTWDDDKGIQHGR
jgi:nitrogen fixation-related uncharacterized protein